MHSTSIDLDEKTRKQTVDLLNARLADIVVLTSQTKMAHWNVKGPNFIALHELFDELNGELAGYMDEIGERITALGGTVQLALGKSILEEYPTTITDGHDHVKALAKGYATFGAATREAIDKSAKWGDEVTAGLFTDITTVADKRLWFLEAHLQAKN